MIPEITVDDSKATAWLGEMPAAVHVALYQKINAQRLQLEALIKQKLSGPILQVKTGALRRSIFSDVTDEGTAIIGRAASSGDVKYAAIQEFGGKTRAHDILPVKGNVLAFLMDGKQVFAKIVHHPGSVIPERSYMRSSLTDLAPEFAAGIKDAVADALKAP